MPQGGQKWKKTKKVNIQILTAFLYTNNEISERECKKKKITLKKSNIGINLTKEVKDLHAENFQTLI